MLIKLGFRRKGLIIVEVYSLDANKACKLVIKAWVLSIGIVVVHLIPIFVITGKIV